jgi:hypothetical protein
MRPFVKNIGVRNLTAFNRGKYPASGEKGGTKKPFVPGISAPRAGSRPA